MFHRRVQMKVLCRLKVLIQFEPLQMKKTLKMLMIIMNNNEFFSANLIPESLLL